MSTSNHYGRSGVQGPVPDAASHAYHGYGAIEAALGQTQAADNSAPHYVGRAIGILGNITRALIILLCALIAFAIFDGILSAISGALIVTGHWILLHLNPTSSPYSEVSLWSTFVLGFWGSAATAIPFWLLYGFLDSNFKFVRAEECLPAFLTLALVIAKIGLECIVGVPLVGHFGVTTLQLGDAICVAYVGVLALLLGMVGIMALLLLAVWLFIVFRRLVSEAFPDPAPELRGELRRALYDEMQRTYL
ncbi:hypothetical protein ARMGADRAFT_1032777 [Armillaria gallica]|uniref:Uncharacterized protein n=1 Tax=Armillaria gallica TaxID=47427 RepID=A0A2H3DPP7_ARMGA|nr:hypothetical protein ARMGADRAFT_1032777 [Armillaria gallica]